MNTLIAALKHRNITNAQRVSITEKIDNGFGVFSVIAWPNYTEVDFRDVNTNEQEIIWFNLDGKVIPEITSQEV